MEFSVSRHGTARGNSCMKGQGFVTTLPSASVMMVFTQKRFWVRFRKLGEMGVLQLGTWRKECVHCDLVLWVFRSSIDVFRPIFDHVAAKRDLKQLKHHIASGCPDAHARGFV